MLRSNLMNSSGGRVFNRTYDRLEKAAVVAARRNDAMLLYIPDSGLNALQFSIGYTPSFQGNPIGRLLDMQYGPPTLGPELVGNGGFDLGVTGWTTAAGVISVVDGKMRTTRSGGTVGRASRAISCIPGRTYRISADRSVTGGVANAGVIVAISSTSAIGAIYSNYAGSGSLVSTFIATQATHWVLLDTGNGTDGQYAEYDNVSVREIIEPQTVLGPELVSNGAFTVPGTGWSAFPNGGTITIDSGAAIFSGAGNSSPVINTLNLLAGKTYVVQYDVSGVTAGGVRVESGGAGVYGVTRSIPGTYTEMITASSYGSFAFKSVGVSTSLTIDNVSVKEVLVKGSRGLDLLVNGDFSSWSSDNPLGWTLSMAETSSEFVTQGSPGGRLVSTTGNFTEIYQPVCVIGKTYECIVNVSACTGTGSVSSGGLTPLSFTGPGIYRAIFTAASVNFGLKRGTVGSAADFTISSITLKEVFGYHCTQGTAANKPTVTRVPRDIGPELVSNGGFDSSSVWTTQPVSLISGGVLTLDAQYRSCEQPVALVNGASYLLTYDVVSASGTNPLALSGTGFTAATTIIPSVVGRNAAIVTCVDQTKNLRFIAPNTGTSVVIDNVSLRQISSWSNAIQLDGVDDWMDVTFRDYFASGAYTFIGSWFGPITGNSSFVLVQSSLTNTQPICSPLFVPIGSTGASLFERGDTGLSGLSGSSYVTAGLTDTFCVELQNSSPSGVGNFKGWSSGVIDKNQNYTRVTESMTTSKVTFGAAQRTSVSGFSKGTFGLLCWAPSVMPDADRRAIAKFAAFLVGKHYV